MSNRIKRSVRLAALSAGIMYLFDPDLGNRRRSFLRDQFHRGVNRLGQRIDVLGQDLENRLIGKVRELDGSALQGGARAAGESNDWKQQNWSPTTRFVAGAIGGIAMLNCLAKRTLPAVVAGTGGFLLFVRAVGNQELAGALSGENGRARSHIGASKGSRQPQGVPAGSNAPQGTSDRRTIGSVGVDRGPMSDDQLVDEASEESFPASDAPSFTGRQAHGTSARMRQEN
jgi:hypothetical protein